MPQTIWEKRRDKWQWFLCRYSHFYPYAAVAFTVDPEFRKRILEAPPPPSFLSRWANTEIYLSLLKSLAERDHARLLLCYAPDSNDFASMNPMYESAARFALNHRFPFFEAGGFLSSSDKDLLYLPGDGHFSPEGHRCYGEELAGWMKRMLKAEVRRQN